jgi:hypothetical protein
MAKRATEAQFFEALGRAVVAWQGVEVTTSALFAVMLKAGNEIGARALFYRVGNFAMRIEFLDIAAKFLLAEASEPSELTKRWDGLRGRLFSASDLRNRLAHSEVGEDDQGLKLRPPMLDLSRIDPADVRKGVKAKMAREVTYESVKAAEFQFEVLCHDLHHFRSDIGKAGIGGG